MRASARQAARSSGVAIGVRSRIPLGDDRADSIPSPRTWAAEAATRRLSA